MNEEWTPPTVLLTVDLVVLTVRDDRLQVLLIERGEDPYLGTSALPGGFVNEYEGLDEAAVRELAEEAGLDGRRLHLEQLRTYATPGRDPRARVATVAYLAIAPDLPVPVAGTDARAAAWVPAGDPATPLPELAFDHGQILADAIERARGKLEYTTLAAAFCADEFTMGELRRVYEVVWGVALDGRNFHRKMLGAKGFLVPTGGRRMPEVGRPAVLYRRGPAGELYPPLLRSGGYPT
jgi:8-oxo-dGTP diphosphatase